MISGLPTLETILLELQTGLATSLVRLVKLATEAVTNSLVVRAVGS
jgi:hypothetical protein